MSRLSSSMSLVAAPMLPLQPLITRRSKTLRSGSCSTILTQRSKRSSHSQCLCLSPRKLMCPNSQHTCSLATQSNLVRCMVAILQPRCQSSLWLRSTCLPCNSNNSNRCTIPKRSLNMCHLCRLFSRQDQFKKLGCLSKRCNSRCRSLLDNLLSILFSRQFNNSLDNLGCSRNLSHPSSNSLPTSLNRSL